jgi:acetolactate synthase regulatory subunit
MGIRSLHHKMDLLLEEQIKKLYDLQAMEIELLRNIKAKMEG